MKLASESISNLHLKTVCCQLALVITRHFCSLVNGVIVIWGLHNGPNCGRVVLRGNSALCWRLERVAERVLCNILRLKGNEIIYKRLETRIIWWRRH
jgi:hypothetical protein